MMHSKFWIYFLWLVTLLVAVVECSWGSPGSGQYHIQTDEGPERYFRFQTDNGQFRKERRLKDGTVIGTEAWIDAAGYLRQKDYIADDKGYRILKSKTVYVGVNQPVEDAIKSTKSVPAQSGVLVDNRKGLKSRTNSVHHVDEVKHAGYVYSTTSAPFIVSSTTVATPIHRETGGKLNYLSPEEAALIEPQGQLGFDHYPDELQRKSQVQSYAAIKEPVVYIRHHADPIELVSPEDNALDDKQYYSSTTERTLSTPSPPSLSIEAPFYENPRRIRPIAVVSTTPAPIASSTAAPVYGSRKVFAYSSSPAPFVAAPIVNPIVNRGYNYAAAPDYYGSTIRSNYQKIILPLDVNGLDEGLLPPPAPTPMPSYRRLRPPSSAALKYNSIGSEREPYDGIATTRNGFRYFLPRQYHEEEQINHSKRAGSFGYVDPFGIRRVVYYNASPEKGFVHRNNNQYVGLHAAPYDSPAEPNHKLNERLELI